MPVHGITAENAENLEEIEKQWAVKAMHHAETYFNLLTKVDGAKLRLTKIDDEIYEDFVNHFPHLNVASLDEMNDFKTEDAKAKWREFIMKWVLCLSGSGLILLTQSHPSDMRTRSRTTILVLSSEFDQMPSMPRTIVSLVRSHAI